METKDLQKLIDITFKEHFAYTPLKERLKDIQNEFFELIKWQDVNNLKEESGDLLASIFELCTESGWNAEELILNTLSKINRREEQYKTLGRKTKVAILGGNFDPIHLGHIQLAQFVLNSSGEFDEVWLMPSNEHLVKNTSTSPEHRLAMCELAAKVDGRIKIFDYEIKNQLKGETYYFFKRLKEEKELTEKYQFAMIIGLDNANSFNKWVNYEELERMARFVVIPRPGIERDINVDWYLKQPHIFLNGESKIMEASSTLVRTILTGPTPTDVLNYLSQDVYDYIKEHKLYL